MSSLNHKKRRPLRRMTAKTTKEIPQTPEHIRKLLKPIENFELGSDSTSSEISDVFEELHRESFFNSKKSGRKDITKLEADRMTVDHFTDDFKATMAIVRKELGIPDEMINESTDDIAKVLAAPKQPRDLPDDVREKIRAALADPSPVRSLSPCESACKPSELSYDYMSGVWKMLVANCGPEFEVSPTNYDSRKQAEPHWLDKPEVPRAVLDGARDKCKKWLEEQHI